MVAMMELRNVRLRLQIRVATLLFRSRDGPIMFVEILVGITWSSQDSPMLKGGYPLGDKAALVADVYLRTVATMDKLRETLRDEHSFLMQVRVPWLHLASWRLFDVMTTA